VAMTVDPSLVILGQAKPSFQIEIVAGPFRHALAHEKTGKETEHHRSHVVTNRILSLLELIDQLLESLLAIHAILGSGFEGCGDLPDNLDVFSNCLLLLLDFV
jgi:hypothetical protein